MKTIDYWRVIAFVANEIWQRAIAKHEAQQDLYTRQLWDGCKAMILGGEEIARQTAQTKGV